ncbi:MAG: FHA domain-containing protein [Magnetococcales bacterium]|nr:FHA domain-containing protein [Magnetococcales bacterium]
MGTGELDGTVFNWGPADGAETGDSGAPVEVTDMTDAEAAHLAEAPPGIAVVAGETSDTIFDLSPGETIIGRHPAHHVTLNNGDISRDHIRLILSEDLSEVTIEPLKAMNVTLINGQPIQEKTAITDGSSITLGNACVLRYLAKGNQERILFERSFAQNNIDPITGCWNKNRFMDVGSRQVKLCLVANQQISLALLQVVGMKAMREGQGEEALHAALKQIAEHLKGTLDVPGASVSHIVEGGFAILYPNTPINSAFKSATEVSEWFQGGVLDLTCSMGLAAARQGVTTLDQLITNTTSALQRSMSMGANQVRSY